MSFSPDFDMDSLEALCDQLYEISGQNAIRAKVHNMKIVSIEAAPADAETPPEFTTNTQYKG